MPVVPKAVNVWQCNPPFCLSSVQRLKTRPQFEAALSQRPLARTAHFSLHCCASADSDLWLGASLPKRWAKRAVTRNAIRRQVYAVATSVENRLPRSVHVVRLRAAFDRKQFVSASSEQLKAAVRAELQQLFSSKTDLGLKPSLPGDGTHLGEG